MGIQQRMASSGDIAKHVGITINKRIESPAPVSSMKSGTVVSKAPRKITKRDRVVLTMICSILLLKSTRLTLKKMRLIVSSQ